MNYLIFSSDKYKNLFNDIVQRNGYIAFENIDLLFELMKGDIKLKVVYPFKSFVLSLNTLLHMRDNGFKTNLGVHEINYNSIEEIFLDNSVYDSIMYHYKKNTLT